MLTITQLDALYDWQHQSFSSSESSLLESLHHLHSFITHESLFSSNEELDDVSTSSLPYLLVPFFLGIATSNSSSLSRLQAISHGKSYLNTFTTLAYNYNILSESLISSFSLLSDDLKPKEVDAYEKRKFLVLRQKRIKELLSLIEPINVNTSDEENIRQHYIIKIELAVVVTFKTLEFLVQEENMLKEVEKMKSEGRDVVSEYQSEKAKMFRKPLTKLTREDLQKKSLDLGQNSRSNLPLSHVMGQGRSRQEVNNQVFDVSHRLFTISSEEADQMEAERIFNRMEKEEKEKIQQEIHQRQLQNQSFYIDSTIDSTDFQTYKDRYWDDWKDANPKGTGNSLRGK
ncbi:hypothetical protein P9112_007215 [Eukaryota sp. TZLM1-RC]